MNKIATGWINGLLGVVIFAGSLPATRVAVADFSPLFLTAARATIAALLGMALVFGFRQKWPERRDLISLCIVAAGVVIGFPMLTALALEHIKAAYSIVFIGLLPLSTAIFGVLRAGEKPHAIFWVFSGLGSMLVAGFALAQGVSTSLSGNLYMVAAIIICGLGYAEGAKLARTLGGWQVISWALILALPVMAPLAFFSMPATFDNIGQPAWAGLAYVSVFSMLVGFVFWYRGLAAGGIGAIGQLQLLQPFFGLALAAIILRENVSWAMLGTTMIIVLCVAGARHFAH